MKNRNRAALGENTVVERGPNKINPAPATPARRRHSARTLSITLRAMSSEAGSPAVLGQVVLHPAHERLVLLGLYARDEDGRLRPVLEHVLIVPRVLREAHHHHPLTALVNL